MASDGECEPCVPERGPQVDATNPQDARRNAHQSEAADGGRAPSIQKGISGANKAMQ